MAKKLFITVVALLLSAALTACASTGGAEPTPLPAPTLPPGPAQMSEAELRQAVGASGSAGDAVRYYLELRARDLLTQADYEGLAQAYEELGDNEGLRQTLLWMFVMYPSEEYAQRLSAVVADAGAESYTAELAENAVELLRAWDPAGLRELVSTESWNALFHDGLQVVQIRSRYVTGEGGVLQVTEDYMRSRLSYLAPDGEYIYFALDGEGATMASAVYTDGAYNGPVRTERYDAAGELLISYSGTLAGDICSGELNVSYGGKDYTGSVNGDGTTAEAQQKSVTNDGGVIYAWSGNDYLYTDGAEDGLILDCAFLGLPRHTVWG